MLPPLDYRVYIASFLVMREGNPFCVPDSKQILVSHCSFHGPYLSDQFWWGHHCLVNSAATKLILLQSPQWQIIIRARCGACFHRWRSFMAQSKWIHVSGLYPALCLACGGVRDKVCPDFVVIQPCMEPGGWPISMQPWHWASRELSCLPANLSPMINFCLSPHLNPPSAPWFLFSSHPLSLFCCPSPEHLYLSVSPLPIYAVTLVLSTERRWADTIWYCCCYIAAFPHIQGSLPRSSSSH